MNIAAKNIALDCPGSTETPSVFVLDAKPGHREFSHISPALIVSSANKRGGVKRYIDNHSVCAVTNHNIRPADLWGEVIDDANQVPVSLLNRLAELR